MSSVSRATLILASAFIGMLGALAQTNDPLTQASDEALHRGEIHTALSVYDMAWAGRELGMVDAGAEVGLTNSLSAGISVRDTSGHGRSDTHYDAEGGHVWGTWQLLHAAARHPGLALLVEQINEQIHLSSVDATSSLTAAPTYASTGAQLRMSATRAGKKIAAYAGIYTATLNHEDVATVEAVGGEVEIPLSRYWYVKPALAGYWDNYEGRHVSYEASLALHAKPTHHLDLAIAASLFPRGIPLAGTPFSTASTVGLIYGSSASPQLRTETLGYFSVSGEYRF